MKRFPSLLFGFIAVLCFFVATERPAWGYVDPGSGLLAMQGLASLLGTVAFYFRKRIRGLFRRKTDEPKAAAFPSEAKREPQNAG